MKIDPDQGNVDLRRQPIVLSTEKSLDYPFGIDPVVWISVWGMIDFRVHENTPYYAALRTLDPMGIYLPEKIGEKLGRGGQQSVYEGNPGQVLKFAGTYTAERMIITQDILQAYRIPYLPLHRGPIALALARHGLTIQTLLPSGAVSLEEIGRGCDRMVEVEQRIRKRFKKYEAEVESLREFEKKIEAINSNPDLFRQMEDRGMTVRTRYAPSPSIIDTLGGGDWGANIYHYCGRWFLGDW